MGWNYELTSPWVTISFNGRPPYWRVLATVWFTTMVTLGLALIYAFAVVLPNHIGFQTTLLVGVAVALFQLEALRDAT